MKKIAILLFGVLLLSILPHTDVAGQDKIAAFLKRIDTDRDGRVDTREMTPQIRRYLKSKGFDTNRSVKISSVVNVVAKSKGVVAAKGDSKVPSFGVEHDKSKTGGGVLSFGGVGTPNYSDDIKKRAGDLVRKYDRNRNNVLDADELRRIPWGNPQPSQSDKNGDGRLSLPEVQARYYEREVAERNRQAVQKNVKVAIPSKHVVPTVYRGAGSPSSSVAVQSQAAAMALQKQREKITRYATEYFQKHDTNKNGMLDKDEMKKMRRPPTKADTNKDERVSKNEFIASQLPKTAKLTGTTSAKPSSRSSRWRNSRGSTSKSGSSKSGSSKSGSTGVFGGKDKNNDNILQMHEFADRWTQDTLDEFNKKDVNGDGLLTPGEWQKR